MMEGVCQIQIEVAIVSAYSEDEDCYYAFSPHLDLIRDGATEDEAIALFKDAFEIMALSRLRKGNLVKHLRRAGFLQESCSDDKGNGMLVFYAPGKVSFQQVSKTHSLGSPPASMEPFRARYPLENTPAACLTA